MHGQAASELLVGALWELPGLAMGRGLPGGLYRAGVPVPSGYPNSWMVYMENPMENDGFHDG